MEINQESKKMVFVRHTVNRANIDVVINLLKKMGVSVDDLKYGTMYPNPVYNQIISMSSVIIKEAIDWPSDKVGRWVGFIQCLAVNEGIITVDGERDETRPTFKKAYKEVGFKKIPSKKV